MKIVFIVAVLILGAAVILLACPKGSEDYNGTCVVNLQPAESVKGDKPEWVSNEKPPKTTTGQWQTGDVKIVPLTSQTAETETDAQIAYAKLHNLPPAGVEK